MVITDYEWDYTFHKWCCKYLQQVKGHNCWIGNGNVDI